MKHMKQMDMSTEKKYSLINYNFKLVLFVIAAMIMGTITICSVRPDFQTKQLIGVGACVIGMIIVSLIDYNFICKYYMILYAGNILLLLLVLLVGSGGGDQGVRRWFYISDSFTIQPSEFAKIILIICTAVFLEKLRRFEHAKGTCKACGIFGCSCWSDRGRTRFVYLDLYYGHTIYCYICSRTQFETHRYYDPDSCSMFWWIYLVYPTG